MQNKSDFVTFYSADPYPLPLYAAQLHTPPAYQMSGCASLAPATLSLAWSSGQNAEETAAL